MSPFLLQEHRLKIFLSGVSIKYLLKSSGSMGLIVPLILSLAIIYRTNMLFVSADDYKSKDSFTHHKTGEHRP